MLDFTKLALFCLLCTAALGYEFEGGDAVMDCVPWLNNDRMVNGAVACLLSDNPECGSVLFTEIKKYAPEVLETVCGKCTDAQKEMYKQCVNKFKKIRPSDYEDILKKMDPESKYKGPLEAFLAS